MNKQIKKEKWNFIDKFLSSWRYGFIMPYLNKNVILCDIGCGREGKFLLSVSQKIKQGYGYDFKLNKNLKKENITLTKGDFSKYNLKYDLVVFMAVLEHLENPKQVLKQINSKLNKGGKLILTTPDKRSKWLLEFLAYKLKIISEEEIRDHKHYFNKVELIKILKETNFKLIKHKHFQLGLNNLVICEKKK